MSAFTCHRLHLSPPSGHGWLLLVLLLTWAGCGNPDQERKKQKPVPVEKDRAVLQIRKTPCSGTCPAYEALLFESGRVLYIGEAFVPEEGNLELQLSPETVRKMVKQARELRFSSLASHYPARTPDSPITYLTWYEGEQYKTVRHQEGGPRALQALIQYLHEALEEAVLEHSATRR